VKRRASQTSDEILRSEETPGRQLVVNVVPATTVTKISAAPGSGTEFSGDKIAPTVDMTAPVTVIGTPALTLSNGGTGT